MTNPRTFLLACAGVLACGSSSPPAAARWGQWVWTPQDAAIYTALREKHPEIRAGVLVAELGLDGDEVVSHLRLAPDRARGADVVVIRLDDALHPLWERHAPADVASRIGPPLAAVLRLVARRSEHFELQLDYDCPTRYLQAWSEVLGLLSAGPLEGRVPWITSLPSHVETAGYGAWFTGKIAGHILQVFDTGRHADTAGALADAAERQGLAYRIGLGAFERVGTGHRRWFSETGRLCRAPLCDEIWVFPAGQLWSPEGKP